MNFRRICAAAWYLSLIQILVAAPGNDPQMPLFFVDNAGQASADVRYLADGPQFKAWFRNSDVLIQQGTAVTKISFEGGRPVSEIEAGKPLGATANYLRGNDPARWKTDLPLFDSIVYKEVWPGVSVLFKAENARLTIEYITTNRLSAANIRLRFDGQTEIRSDGSLVVSNETGKFFQPKPVLFQEGDSGSTRLEAEFQKVGDGLVGVTAVGLDTAGAVIPGPGILFSGYFGGSSESSITAVAVNSYYNIIVAGWTISTDLPSSKGLQTRYAGGVDAFVASFSPAGGSLVFCTYLGGSADDRAFGVAVDGSNNTYVTGQTSSTNFPVVNAVQTKLKGVRDAFVAKLNPAGNALVYSTYLGGSGADLGNAIALDSNNSAIIVGDTTSSNLPVTASVFQPALAGAQDAFVAKLSPSGNAVLWLTYLGGTAFDHGAALVVDASGAPTVGGSTYSIDFPVHSAFQPQSGGGEDGFVSKLSPTGTSLVFSSYIGGSGGSSAAPEAVNAISFVSGGDVLLGGITSSPDFPIVGPVFQPSYGGGNTDGFMSTLNPFTGALVRSTYIGGSGDDSVNGVASDNSCCWLYLAGYTSSSDFPTRNPIHAGNAGGLDAFVAKLNYSSIQFATYLGGSGNDSASALAVDSAFNIIVVGTTGSANFPVVGNLTKYQPSVLSSFVTKIASHFTMTVAAPPSFVFDVWHDSGYNGPNITLNTSSYGLAGDIPIAGDWNGSGTKKIGLFRNGTWILDTNGNGVLDSADQYISFGQSGDVPIVGDWNGTGRIKLGLFRQGSFILDLSGHLSGVPTGLNDASFPFGLTSDIPVVADWNASGTAKVGVFRNGTWLIDYNGDHLFNAADKSYTYGQTGDLPVVGDWSGSGTANQIGVFRHGLWFLNARGDNQFSAQGQYEYYFAFGSAGYLPLIF